MKKNLINIGIKAKKASKIKIDSKNKNKVLKKFLNLINKNKKKILKENNKDIKFAIKNNLPENLVDRLTLNQKKLEEMQASIQKIIKLGDPINKLIGRVNREGYTVVPTKLYLKNGKIKIEIAVAKGKKIYDKRNIKKTRDWNREKSRYFRKTS